MKRLALTATVVAMAAGAWAAGIDPYMTTGEDGRKIIDIGGGVTYTLTADDVAAIGAADIVKIGEGTLVANAAMANYVGNIFVSNGYYRVDARGALGTAAGQTYIDGGTLYNRISSPTDGSNPTFKEEHIHLSGTGFKNEGAVKDGAGAMDFCRTVTLEGDTLIHAGGRMDFRYTALNMNGHALSTHGNFYLVAVTISNAGDFVVDQGYFELQSGVSGTSSAHTITVKSGTKLGFWNSSSWIAHRVIFEPGSMFGCSNGTFKYAGTDNRSILSGPTEFQGMVTNVLNANTQIQFRGYTYGPGGIVTGNKGGWMQFLDSSTNSFEGGVSAAGIVTNGNDAIGGILIYKNGAIPYGSTAGAVELNDAVLHTRTITAVDLPDLVVNGVGVVTNDGQLTTCNVKSLVKTGAGDLTVHGPLRVKGGADIRGGRIVCAKPIPNVLPGMLWAYNTTGSIVEQDESKLVARSDYKGIDNEGLTYAYKTWENRGNAQYDYIGYFKVPEREDGQDPRCRFISCIWRYLRIWVDGTQVLRVDDSNVVTPNVGKVIGWSRHYWSDPLTLKPGWHKIVVSMGGLSSYSDNGPQGCKDATYGLWPGSFGVGVDFDSSATAAKDAKDASGVYEDSITNAVNYVKFTDPGDGSFVRASTNENIKVNGAVGFSANSYRPSFEGPVAFAGGTVLDLNDYEPYTTMAIPSLTGLPTIRRGAVNVASTIWTIRPSDLEAGVPLTVEADARLTFGGAKTVTIDGDAAAFAALKGLGKGTPIFTAPDLADYTFTLSDNLRAVNCGLVREGNVLKFCVFHGLNVIVR